MKLNSRKFSPVLLLFVILLVGLSGCNLLGYLSPIGSSTNIPIQNPTGSTWTISPTALPISISWLSVTFGNGLFVAVGSYSNITATSPDGMTWTTNALPSISYWDSVAYGNGVFVAIAIGNTAATSPDGVTWINQSLPCSATWNSIAYGNGEFVAVAQTTNLAMISQDGIHWNSITLSIPNNSIGNGWWSITYGNCVF